MRRVPLLDGCIESRLRVFPASYRTLLRSKVNDHEMHGRRAPHGDIEGQGVSGEGAGRHKGILPSCHLAFLKRKVAAAANFRAQKKASLGRGHGQEQINGEQRSEDCCHW
jgi:hypothetical protein